MALWFKIHTASFMCHTVPTLTITESKVINYTNLEHLARKNIFKTFISNDMESLKN